MKTPIYYDLNVVEFAEAFLRWFVPVSGFVPPIPDPTGIIGVDLPEAFRPLASALVFSTRPTDGLSDAEARSYARAMVAAALIAWRWKERAP